MSHLAGQSARMTENTNAGHDSPQAATQPADREPSSAATRPNCHVKVSSPADLLALVPHLLGFYPSDSLVVLGLRGKRHKVEVGFRYDLPGPDSGAAAEIAEHAVGVLARQHIRTAILVGYGSAEQVTPVADALVTAMRRSGVTVRERLRAQGGRYWSALCADPACCPPEGAPFDPGSHPTAARLAAAGMNAYPDRAALARTLEPAPDSAAAIRRATNLALTEFDELIRTASQTGEARDLRAVDAARAKVRAAIRRSRAGESVSGADELAALAVAMADLRVRDDAWARMEPEHRNAHRRLWTAVVTSAAAEFVPAPASLLAFTAWQAGEGALASVAVERALAADPEYSMAWLVSDAMHAGLPPSAARLPMTPEQVAESYESRYRGVGQVGKSGNQDGRARWPRASVQGTAWRRPAEAGGHRRLPR